ncbi:MAG: hypothetical protein KUG75_07490 [Pseudomonadales bacterium]|nr:hypothetical protein [Pseudomonadales bacterium]
MEHTLDHHRQTLVRCQLNNEQGVQSTRFIDKSQFQLWRYMMIHKHDFTITAATPCLWIPLEEFEKQDKLFNQAGINHAVMQLSMAIYDPKTALCDTLQRFVPREDSDIVKNILLERIPEDLRASENFVMQSIDGIAILHKTRLDTAQPGSTMTN